MNLQRQVGCQKTLSYRCIIYSELSLEEISFKIVPRNRTFYKIVVITSYEIFTLFYSKSYAPMANLGSDEFYTIQFTLTIHDMVVKNDKRIVWKCLFLAKNDIIKRSASALIDPKNFYNYFDRLN